MYFTLHKIFLPIDKTATVNNIFVLLLSQNSGSDSISVLREGSIPSLSSDTLRSASFLDVPLLKPSSRNFIKLGWNAAGSFGLTNQCMV